MRVRPVALAAVLALALAGAGTWALTRPAHPAAPPATVAAGTGGGAPAPVSPAASPSPSASADPTGLPRDAAGDVVLGRSVQGRPITATERTGPGPIRLRLVVVGVIHGDEKQGGLVTQALRTMPTPAGMDLWLVDSMNPDGEAVPPSTTSGPDGGQRDNAAGVDLNRNWPAGWHAQPCGIEPPGWCRSAGAAAASEPETQAVMAFLAAVRPDLTVWYHSPLAEVVESVKNARYATAYAAATGVRLRPPLVGAWSGQAPDWVEQQGLGAGMVVEFGYGHPSAELVARHAAALLALPTP